MRLFAFTIVEFSSIKEVIVLLWILKITSPLTPRPLDAAETSNVPAKFVFAVFDSDFTLISPKTSRVEPNIFEFTLLLK